MYRPQLDQGLAAATGTPQTPVITTFRRLLIQVYASKVTHTILRLNRNGYYLSTQGVTETILTATRFLSLGRTVQKVLSPLTRYKETLAPNQTLVGILYPPPTHDLPPIEIYSIVLVATGRRSAFHDLTPGIHRQRDLLALAVPTVYVHFAGSGSTDGANSTYARLGVLLTGVALASASSAASARPAYSPRPAYI